jgi:hypothetical protein
MRRQKHIRTGRMRQLRMERRRKSKIILFTVIMIAFLTGSVASTKSSNALVRHTVPAIAQVQLPKVSDMSEFEMPVIEFENVKPLKNDFVVVPVPTVSNEKIIKSNIGTDIINIDDTSLVRYDLPDVYYDDIDYSTFQPYMCYSSITNKTTQAWKVVHSGNAYTDSNGFRRYKIRDDQFSVNGEDDYVVALGTYYKEKGTCGSRYLVVTSTGMYTAITGDEKSDNHTDEMHMFTVHGGGKKAGLIEWIVDMDSNKVPLSIQRMGSVTNGPIEELQGKILYIYKIQS